MNVSSEIAEFRRYNIWEEARIICMTCHMRTAPDDKSPGETPLRNALGKRSVAEEDHDGPLCCGEGKPDTLWVGWEL